MSDPTAATQAPDPHPTVDRSGYEVTVSITTNINDDEAPRSVHARLLAGTDYALAYELAALACEHHPAAAAAAVADHEERTQ